MWTKDESSLFSSLMTFDVSIHSGFTSVSTIFETEPFVNLTVVLSFTLFNSLSVVIVDTSMKFLSSFLNDNVTFCVFVYNVISESTVS